MKWLILFIWLGSILFIHLRGVVRFPLRRQLTHGSSWLAPLNAILILLQKVPTTPYIPTSRLSELSLLEDNWQTIRDEALESEHFKTTKTTKATDPTEPTEPSQDNDSIESSEHDSLSFYLKNQSTQQFSAEMSYPQTAALLAQIPTVQAARFLKLPAGAQRPPIRDAYGQSLQYNLGLSTPNFDDCYTDVDGLRHVWQDGQAVLLDPTYVYESHNKTNQPCLVLVCDVQRPLHSQLAETISRGLSKLWQSAQRQFAQFATKANQTGLAKRLNNGRDRLDQKRQAFKAANPPLYKAIEVGLVVLAILFFLAL